MQGTGQSYRREEVSCKGHGIALILSTLRNVEGTASFGFATLQPETSRTVSEVEDTESHKPSTVSSLAQCKSRNLQRPSPWALKPRFPAEPLDLYKPQKGPKVFPSLVIASKTLRHYGQVDRWQTTFAGLVRFLPGIWPSKRVFRVEDSGVEFGGWGFMLREVQLALTSLKADSVKGVTGVGHLFALRALVPDRISCDVSLSPEDEHPSTTRAGFCAKSYLLLRHPSCCCLSCLLCTSGSRLMS